MWARVKAFCLHSCTVAVSYVVAAIGIVLQFIDTLGLIVGDDNFKAELREALSTYPQILGWIMIGISVVVFIARLRSILGWGQH